MTLYFTVPGQPAATEYVGGAGTGIVNGAIKEATSGDPLFWRWTAATFAVTTVTPSTGNAVTQDYVMHGTLTGSAVSTTDPSSIVSVTATF